MERGGGVALLMCRHCTLGTLDSTLLACCNDRLFSYHSFDCVYLCVSLSRESEGSSTARVGCPLQLLAGYRPENDSCGDAQNALSTFHTHLIGMPG